MQSDTIKLLASYLTAVILAVGGCLLLVYVWQQPVEGKDGIMALLGGFVGMAITFLFTGNAGTAAVRTFQSGLNTPVPVEQAEEEPADAAG